MFLYFAINLLKHTHTHTHAQLLLQGGYFNHTWFWDSLLHPQCSPFNFSEWGVWLLQMPSQPLGDGGHVTERWAWPVGAAGAVQPYQLELWLREEERVGEQERGEKEGKGLGEFLIVMFVLCASLWWGESDRGGRGEKGEKRGRRWTGALRRLVSKLVCQVFLVSCVEDEVLRWRVFFWQEICGKPFNLACRPCAFSFLLFFSLYAFPLFSHWGEFGGWALPLPPHSTSSLLFSPSHPLIVSSALEHAWIINLQ